MDLVQHAKSRHSGAPMGMADIATVLFKNFLRFDAADPHWFDRNRFVLSNGHASMLIYSLLYLTGYQDMTLNESKKSVRTAAKPARPGPTVSTPHRQTCAQSSSASTTAGCRLIGRRRSARHEPSSSPAARRLRRAPQAAPFYERHRTLRRTHPVRRHVPVLLRLLPPVDPLGGADADPHDLRNDPTRSVWAKMVLLISRSNTLRRCEPFLIRRFTGREIRSRPPSAGDPSPNP
jgi:hypothetical protein